MIRSRGGRCARVAVALLLLAACSDDAPMTSSSSSGVPFDETAVATTGVAATTSVTTVATTTTLAEIVVPDGVLAAVPFQNRLDVPAGIFQTKFVNGSDERLSVVGLQFVWSGFTSAVVERTAVIVPGQRVDLPLPFPGATCIGDGSADDMPDPADAYVRLELDDGTERTVPVFDRDHVARRMYLDDCERQRIAREVSIAWEDLGETTFEDRPVTEGLLVVTRRTSTSAVTVGEVSSTIVFDPEPAGDERASGGPLLVLEPQGQTASVPIRFLESRCDPHALSEASQAFLFVVRVDLGDGVVRPYVVAPPPESQGPMRATLTAGCDELGKIRPFDPDSGQQTGRSLRDVVGRQGPAARHAVVHVGPRS